MTQATIIHPHLHARRTGVTGHVESVVPALASTGVFDVATVGRALAQTVPRIGWREVWRRARGGPVVWHAHRNIELLAGVVLRLFAPRMRIVFTRHAGARPGVYTRLLAKAADRRVALTPTGAREFVPAAEVVGHGVDLSRFHPPADRREAHRALGLPGERAIGIVGRVRPEKGHGDFAEAVAPLLARFPDWHVAFVGRVAPSDRGFADLLRQQLGDRVTFAGEDPDVARWYRGLDVIVHPSWTEGYSLVLLEALASGCCTIASRLPYTEGLVEDGRNGFLFAPRDVAALRRALEAVMADPALAERVGRDAAEDARRRLGVEAEARALSTLYQGLLDGARR